MEVVETKCNRGPSPATRPLVTFALFAYNQERFVREAVAAALAQTWSPLQVILSDDASSDATFAIMEQLAGAYRGPHEVVLNRNVSNLGIGGHVNRVMELARGELIVVAAGDDVSFPHRTARIAETWIERDRAPTAVHSAVLEMNEAGYTLRERAFFRPELLNSPAEVARRGIGVLGASSAWTAEVFERFGPLMKALPREDNAVTLRASLLGPIEYLHEPLVRWRVGVSTWHDMHAESYDVMEMQRRNRRLLELAQADVTQALADLDRLDPVDKTVRSAAEARMLELGLMLRIARGESIGLRDVAVAVARGVDPRKILSCHIKYRHALAYSILLQARAGLGAGRRWER